MSRSGDVRVHKNERVQQADSVLDIPNEIKLEAVVQHHAAIQPFRGRWERKLEVLIVICE